MMKLFLLILASAFIHKATAQVTDTSIQLKSTLRDSIITNISSTVQRYAVDNNSFHSIKRIVLAKTPGHNTHFYWHPVEQRLVPYQYRSGYKDNWFTNAANFAAEFLLLNPKVER